MTLSLRHRHDCYQAIITSKVGGIQCLLLCVFVICCRVTTHRQLPPLAAHRLSSSCPAPQQHQHTIRFVVLLVRVERSVGPFLQETHCAYSPTYHSLLILPLQDSPMICRPSTYASGLLLLLLNSTQVCLFATECCAATFDHCGSCHQLLLL